MGLNFYGYSYTSNPQKATPVVGSTYLQLLEEYNPKLIWDPSSKEHIISLGEGKDSSKLYYPTLKSVHERIKLAQELGVSLTIWEVGQGLDYFYDLL